MSIARENRKDRRKYTTSKVSILHPMKSPKAVGWLVVLILSNSTIFVIQNCLRNSHGFFNMSLGT